MHKIESLESVHASLEPVRQQLLKQLLYEHPVPIEREQLLRQVGELSLLQEEVIAHRQALELADLSCARGLDGTAPDQWDEVMKGEVYDAHQEIVESLSVAPARVLSPELLAYIDQIPAQSKQDYLAMIERARADTTIWPGNPLKELTDDEVARRGDKLKLEKLETMLFATTYADEVAHAWQLAEVRGDFARIRELLT